MAIKEIKGKGQIFYEASYNDNGVIRKFVTPIKKEAIEIEKKGEKEKAIEIKKKGKKW
jgi:predicted type IV restriction endonuclease